MRIMRKVNFPNIIKINFLEEIEAFQSVIMWWPREGCSCGNFQLRMCSICIVQILAHTYKFWLCKKAVPFVCFYTRIHPPLFSLIIYCTLNKQEIRLSGFICHQFSFFFQRLPCNYKLNSMHGFVLISCIVVIICVLAYIKKKRRKEG